MKTAVLLKGPFFRPGKGSARSAPWTPRLVIAAVVFVFGALGPVAAGAAAPAYAAKELIRSAKQVDMTPGDTLQFTIGFKNTGTATWTRDGANYVSVYTYDPKYRKTSFSHDTWIKDVQPARMTDAKVLPGQVGSVTFTLFAPLAEGTYHETFQLAAEGLAWMDGGKFTIDIVVKKHAPLSTAAGVEMKFANGYKAAKMLVSDRNLDLEAGTTKEYRVGFKNVGRTSWTKTGNAPLALKAMWNEPYKFKNKTWNDNVVSTLPETEIKPGQMVFLSFSLTAPQGTGRFAPKFMLTAGEELVEGGEVEIPIEVRQGIAPSVVDEKHDEAFSRSGERGPLIRVGLYSTTAPVTIAADGAYKLLDSNDSLVKTLSGVTTTTFDFDTLGYTVRNGDYVFKTNAHVDFVPVDPAATIFEIKSLESRPTWDPTINFNRFRGTLRVHYMRATGKLWVVEELPVEDYMRGLAETSNGSAFEYQKALVTAARTYALFVVSLGGKHANEYHDVNTTGNDQVYKGYASELVRPNVVRAAEETRGMVVTYGGEMVVTPYFSRSDGRTRAWTEVWGGKVHPWLVSKEAPYDKGKELWGHGVGLSASDALGRAEAGASWTEILKYYYSGVELKKLY
ncbi:MAG TPA: SpoIID/LytB domain-containing protein [Candidatus Eisenbacteria bacterium]|nr:SpoIID/LytB domain-containing protein [Candidatus Eisenbacteria bacterium]